MGRARNKANYIKGIKESIRQAIIAKGVDVATTDTFLSYKDKIGNISSGGGSVFGTYKEFEDVTDDYVGTKSPDNKQYLLYRFENSNTINLQKEFYTAISNNNCFEILEYTEANVKDLTPYYTVSSKFLKFKHVNFNATFEVYSNKGLGVDADKKISITGKCQASNAYDTISITLPILKNASNVYYFDLTLLCSDIFFLIQDGKRDTVGYTSFLSSNYYFYKITKDDGTTCNLYNKDGYGLIYKDFNLTDQYITGCYARTNFINLQLTQKYYPPGVTDTSNPQGNSCYAIDFNKIKINTREIFGSNYGISKGQIDPVICYTDALYTYFTNLNFDATTEKINRLIKIGNDFFVVNGANLSTTSATTVFGHIVYKIPITW